MSLAAAAATGQNGVAPETTPMLALFTMLARYNEWANRRVYAAAAELAEPDYKADRGAFFGSVHATLNHLLVTDRMWQSRFSGEELPYSRLDLILHEDLASLRDAREVEDARIVGWVDVLDEEALDSTFTYVSITNPREVTQTLAPALVHLFNHQTHHRGQVHAMLTGIGGKAAGPVLDLVAFQRETGIGVEA